MVYQACPGSSKRNLRLLAEQSAPDAGRVIKSFRRNILRFCGFKPVRTTLISAPMGGDKGRAQWLEKMKSLGRAGR